MLEGANVVVLDLETLHSADDCVVCGLDVASHERDRGYAVQALGHRFQKIGWENHAALDLSIGCYFDYTSGLYQFFDGFTLETVVRLFAERQPLLVSFNGIKFDFRLMQSLLERYARGHDGVEPPLEDWAQDLLEVCRAFERLSATSYDILDQIWTVDSARKFERGLNSLGVISEANGFGSKAMDGAQAPRLWAQGRYAEVINYCMADVTKTKRLFEKICECRSILRGDGKAIDLTVPQYTYVV